MPISLPRSSKYARTANRKQRSSPCIPSNSCSPKCRSGNTTAAQAKTAQQGVDVKFLAGGTTLIDLMKLEVETPSRLVDINRLPFDKIEEIPGGGLKIGATVRNSDLAIIQQYNGIMQCCRRPFSLGLRGRFAIWPLLPATYSSARAVCTSADTAMPCNKREPGTGCSAIIGSNRMLAFWAQRTLHRRQIRRICAWRLPRWKPRSMCKGQGAFAPFPLATFIFCRQHAESRDGTRSRRPHYACDAPPPVAGSKQVYLKLRDRASTEFALASAAVVISAAGGNVTRVRIALGGVGHQTMALAGSGSCARRQTRECGKFPQGSRSRIAQCQAAD